MVENGDVSSDEAVCDASSTVYVLSYARVNSRARSKIAFTLFSRARDHSSRRD